MADICIIVPDFGSPWIMRRSNDGSIVRGPNPGPAAIWYAHLPRISVRAQFHRRANGRMGTPE